MRITVFFSAVLSVASAIYHNGLYGYPQMGMMGYRSGMGRTFGNYGMGTGPGMGGIHGYMGNNGMFDNFNGGGLMYPTTGGMSGYRGGIMYPSGGMFGARGGMMYGVNGPNGGGMFGLRGGRIMGSFPMGGIYGPAGGMINGGLSYPGAGGMIGGYFPGGNGMYGMGSMHGRKSLFKRYGKRG